MKERFSVVVNGVAVEVYRGMTVKHALIAFGNEAYRDCTEGRATVRDENGFVVGLEGALHEGARYVVQRRQGDA
jgi:hypothetical protein